MTFTGCSLVVGARPSPVTVTTTVWSPGSAADNLYETDLLHHNAIVAAITARNPSAARQLMESHILESWQLLSAVLDEV